MQYPNDYYDEETQEIEQVIQPIKKKKKKKRKRRISSQFYWLLLVLSCFIFFVTFFRMPMFPFKWSVIVAIVLLLIMIITGIFTTKLSPRNLFQKTVNLLLTIVMCIGTLVLPYEESKVSSLFSSALGNVTKIHLVAVKEAYKAEHTSTFIHTITVPDDGKDVNLENYKDALFGTFVSVDAENQNYAVGQLNKQLNVQVDTQDYPSVNEAAAALYNNRIDILVVSDAFMSMIAETEGFENFKQDTVILHTFKRELDAGLITQSDITLTKKPFMIFIGGNDEVGELSLQGRTDVCMLLAVNPNTHQIAMLSFPRDSYVPNPYYNNSKDKLTHLGVTGIDNTLKGLGNYIEEPINNYVLLNFTTFLQIVDALGGVYIDNPYTFTAINGTTFEEGRIGLLPDFALLYCRERENLPDGDFGRTMHQQIVMQAIIDQVTSVEGITKFNSILDSIQGYFLTNLSSNAIYGLVQKQLDENIKWNIVKYHIEGTVGSSICASAPGQYLSVVHPYQNQVRFVRDVIDQVMDGTAVTQEEMPAGIEE